jgi:hypothetical protein
MSRHAFHTAPRTGRGFTAIATAVGLALLAFPSIASGSPPTTSSDVAYDTDPGPITVDGATLDFEIFFSAVVGPRGALSYSGPLGSLVAVEGPAELDGSRLVGMFPLIDAGTGEDAGVARYDLLFQAAGEVEPSEQAIRDGNRRIVLESTEQPMVVSGHVTMPDGTAFPVLDAPGERLTLDGWSNEPRSTILDGTETFVEATWLVDGTPVTFRATITALESAGVVFLDSEEGEIIGHGRPVLADDRMTGSFLLNRLSGTLAGTASVALDIATLGSSTSFEVTEFSRRKVVTDDISVSGTMHLTLDGVGHELSFADADVIATRATWHGIQYPFANDGEG